VTAAFAFGLDLAAARWGISRDLEELTLYGPLGFVILAFIAGLPLGSILVLVLRRRLLAIAPLAISIVLVLLWVLYYATDWWSNPGQGGWAPANALFVLGWILLLLAAVPRNGRALRERRDKTERPLGQPPLA
jgi:Kef-type K+ transport system membrane component KefB